VAFEAVEMDGQQVWSWYRAVRGLPFCMCRRGWLLMGMDAQAKTRLDVRLEEPPLTKQLLPFFSKLLLLHKVITA
jgi:hypothetical protein